MQVFGGSGDVGLGEPIDALGAARLRPCDDAECRYETTLTLPVDDVLSALRRMEARGEVLWLEVNLTLVRTFAGGSWLQVLPFSNGGDGAAAGGTGTLGAVLPTHGRIFPFGLFPAARATPIRAGMGMFTTDFDYAASVERARIELGDGSRPLHMVPVDLRAEIEKACGFAWALTMHTDDGDHVFEANIRGHRSIEATVKIPAGTTWRLTLHDGGGIDFDQGRMGTGIRAGNISSSGKPIEVDAAFVCPAMTGTVEVTERP
jgi:hypothetical protein